jgi:hypothetical protein
VTAAKWLLALLVPVLVAASGFASFEDGRAAGVTRTVLPLVVGLGCFPIAFAMSPGRGSLFGIAIVAATCAGSIFASIATRTATNYATLAGWIGIAFVGFLGLVCPLLALGWRAAAAVLWLGGAAAACGSLALVDSGADSVPAPLLAFNPIVRVMRHALSEYDWLHAANLYRKVGTLYYSYPGRTDGVLQTAMVAGAGFVIAGIIAFTRRRASPRQA